MGLVAIAVLLAIPAAAHAAFPAAEPGKIAFERYARIGKDTGKGCEKGKL